MLNEILAWVDSVCIVILWLPLIILPILYVVHSIKTRRRILSELEKLTGEVRSLRQQVKEIEKTTR